MSELEHEQLWSVCRKLLTDFEPYGKQKRMIGGLIARDCSGGCRWYHKLTGAASRDWGVCGNLRSPRSGLLTFEHQGCSHFEAEETTDNNERSHGSIFGLYINGCRSNLMTKADIISKTLKEMNLALPAQESYSDEPDYEEDVIETLESRLADGDIKTCDKISRT